MLKEFRKLLRFFLQLKTPIEKKIPYKKPKKQSKDKSAERDVKFRSLAGFIKNLHPRTSGSILNKKLDIPFHLP